MIVSDPFSVDSFETIKDRKDAATKSRSSNKSKLRKVASSGESQTSDNKVVHTPEDVQADTGKSLSTNSEIALHIKNGSKDPEQCYREKESVDKEGKEVENSNEEMALNLYLSEEEEEEADKRIRKDRKSGSVPIEASPLKEHSALQPETLTENRDAVGDNGQINSAASKDALMTSLSSSSVVVDDDVENLLRIERCCATVQSLMGASSSPNRASPITRTEETDSVDDRCVTSYDKVLDEHQSSAMTFSIVNDVTEASSSPQADREIIGMSNYRYFCDIQLYCYSSDKWAESI